LDVRVTSARAECDPSRSALTGFVLQACQISVEHLADGVAGQVLQDSIDHEPMRLGGPRFSGRQPPGSLFGADLRCAIDAPAVRTDNAEATSEQAVVEWSLEHDFQWLEGVARGDGQGPAGGLDAATFLDTDLVPPLGPGSEGKPAGIAEPLVHDEPE